MGKSSGSTTQSAPTTTTTTNKSEPWAAQQPYLTYGFDQAQDLYKQGGVQPFSKQTYVPFSPATEAGMALTQQRALAGSANMNAANQLNLDTLEGKYLNPDSNPYLQSYYDQAVKSSLPTLNATFSAAGRTGSDAQTNALGDMYGAVSRDIYGGAYNQERNRQMQALGFAPISAANDYQDLSALMGIGSMTEGKAMEGLQDEMNRYYQFENQPGNTLDDYIRRIAGNYGSLSSGTTESTEPLYGNSTGSWLGGLLGGLGGLMSFF